MVWIIIIFYVINDMKIQSDHKIDQSLFWSFWTTKCHSGVFKVDSVPGKGVGYRGIFYIIKMALLHDLPHFTRSLTFISHNLIANLVILVQFIGYTE